MRLLLDTHIWIWAVATPERLQKHFAKALENPENELWLSPISIWELAMLASKKRLELDDAVEGWVARALTQTAVREAPLTNDVVLEVGRLQFSHSDPADHFIAASAKVFDLTLVTADPRLVALRSQGVSVFRDGP